MDQKDNKTTCMACGCPCEMHTEHNHPVEEVGKQEKQEESKSCSTCNTQHKQDGTPACGCK